MHKNKDLFSTKDILAQLMRVRITLRDVLYISYAIPTGKLLELVPETLRLATVVGDTALVSLVILRNTQVRLSTLPFIMFDYYQFNIRTYVIDPISGRNAVYFIRSGVTSRIISMTTRSIGIPWEFIDLEIHIAPLEGLKSLSISGNWEGKISLEAQAISPTTKIPHFFEDTASAVNFLVRPLIGFTGDKKRLGRFTIWHPEVQPESWSLVKLECPIFRKLGLVEDYTNPHSVFYLPAADFSIYLPPTRIKQ